jgi:hypothetical protein
MAIFGEIKNPAPQFNGPQGFFDFLSIIFKVAGIVAGLFFIIKIIMAGFSYMSASGDEKKTATAFATIWQSIIGLVIVAGAFVIAGVIGNILGLDLLNPTF